MTNAQFILKYGYREYYDLLDNLEIRLSILKANRIVGKFRINKRKKTVTFYCGGKKKEYQFGKIFSITDEELSRLLT